MKAGELTRVSRVGELADREWRRGVSRVEMVERARYSAGGGRNEWGGSQSQDEREIGRWKEEGIDGWTKQEETNLCEVRPSR